ncbi:MAG: iron chelate uptake ABC transporter family permease subunit [Ancrocorticia sp.]
MTISITPSRQPSTAGPGAEDQSQATRSVRRAVGLVVAFGCMVVLILLSIALGSKGIPLVDVWHALFTPDGSENDYIIETLRIPRTIVGLVVGAALGLSGALIQALTRNPLAEPGILGVHAGSAFFVALAIGLLGVTDITGYMWFAFTGALLVTVMVMLLGSTRNGSSPIMMVLAGVSIGAILGGATSALTLTNPDAFDQMRGWNAGSIVGRPLEILWPILPFLVIGMILAFIVCGPLNVIALGDDLAVAQGVHLARTRLLAITALTLLAGGATAIAGPIGFVGLMVPHVARWITGPDQRWIFTYSILLAPSLLLASDIIGRIIMRPSEIPVGIITAFIGAPILILLVRRKKASAL